MKITLLPVAVFAVSCLTATSLHAAQGVLITEKVTTGATTRTADIQIEKNRMRAETAGPGGEKQVMVFDGTKQVLYMINADKKTYSEMTKADADQLGGAMAGMMAQMQEQMKNMPPEQRAQIEAMMRGRGMPGAGPAAKPKTEYRRTGTDKVGKWSCTKYEGYLDGKKTTELCTVDPKDIGFSPADFEVTRQLVDFFKALVPQGAEQMFSIGKAEEQGYSGVPVKRVATINGSQMTTELVDAKRENFADAVFTVPAGFKKEDMMGGARGRGPR